MASFTILEKEQPQTPDNLMSGLLREIGRVRAIADEYEKFEAGKFAAAFMRKDIDDAQTAISDGDVVAMIRLFNALKTYEL